jgi:hypothetical protein
VINRSWAHVSSKPVAATSSETNSVANRTRIALKPITFWFICHTIACNKGPQRVCYGSIVIEDPLLQVRSHPTIDGDDSTIRSPAGAMIPSYKSLAHCRMLKWLSRQSIRPKKHLVRLPRACKLPCRFESPLKGRQARGHHSIEQGFHFRGGAKNGRNSFASKKAGCQKVNNGALDSPKVRRIMCGPVPALSSPCHCWRTTCDGPLVTPILGSLYNAR